MATVQSILRVAAWNVNGAIDVNALQRIVVEGDIQYLSITEPHSPSQKDTTRGDSFIKKGLQDISFEVLITPYNIVAVHQNTIGKLVDGQPTIILDGRAIFQVFETAVGEFTAICSIYGFSGTGNGKYKDRSDGKKQLRKQLADACLDKIRNLRWRMKNIGFVIIGDLNQTITPRRYSQRDFSSLEKDGILRCLLEGGFRIPLLERTSEEDWLHLSTQECIDWCRQHQVHLVSDEIYAGSLYRDGGVFQSALELASNNDSSALGDYVHFVYALSKDFALSGLRVGACYSENLQIRLALQKLNDLCQISSQTQHLVETMLTTKDGDDEYWTDTFLKENQARLRKRCDTWQACCLDECDIPHLPADSGLFVWMDMTQFLPPLDPASVLEHGEEEAAQMDTRERTLYLELVKEYGLLFTPGRSMRHERPGFFRCVFSAASNEEFELSLERLRVFVTAKHGSR